MGFPKDTQGLGLGLPLAKVIVEAHDGTITVDSSLSKGTIFTKFAKFALLRAVVFGVMGIVTFLFSKFL